ncbi:hypothetical protein BRADI_1g78126v3 [Brachypodium distachyon]|uniref:Rapid alkalinization factor 1 n=1 Tax=Brachypodium distachyon TaxID=15368 RepID=A0A2K2DVQ4_BRADI|nr:hypothetical protein BRADI_1g78126v3 [Brachypodium distachyon]
MAISRQHHLLMVLLLLVATAQARPYRSSGSAAGGEFQGAVVARKLDEAGSISNGAMGADGIPCDPRRASNCRPGGNSPYNGRGCSPIDRCRGNTASSPSN